LQIRLVVKDQESVLHQSCLWYAPCLILNTFDGTGSPEE
jgi:hypothetical protein